VESHACSSIQVGDRLRAFREILQFYPDEDLPNALSKPNLIEQLYKTYRRKFSHSLGINVPDPEDRDQPKRIEPLERRTKIIRLWIAPDAVAQLEANEERPNWLIPTISRHDSVDTLCIESLYWGVRQLVKRVAADAACAQGAAEFLQTAHRDLGGDDSYLPVRHIPVNTSITFEVSSSAVTTLSITAPQSAAGEGCWARSNPAIEARA
jgi:hypothetical protein